MAETGAAPPIALTAVPQLRALTAADTDAVQALYAATRAHEMAQLPLPPAQREALLRMQFQAQQAHFARHYPGASSDAVLLGGRLIGRLCVWRRPGETVLMDISLLPEFRGAGVGTRLLEALIAEATRTSSELTLHANSDGRARGWYRRLGFEEVQDDGASVMMKRGVQPLQPPPI